MIVVTVARKPMSTSTVASSVLATGTGGLNIDASRIGSGTGGEAPAYVPNKKNAVFGVGMGGGEWDSTKGRWPTNLVLEHMSGCVQEGTHEVHSSKAGARNTALGIMNDDSWKPSPTADKRGYLDADGMETVPLWHCATGCPVAELDAVEPVSRFFKQVRS